MSREQTRRDAEEQIEKNMRILKLAREDQGWALSRILLAERLEREAKSVPALVEALQGARLDFVQIAREGQDWRERGQRGLDALKRVDEALAVYEQSQGKP